MFADAFGCPTCGLVLDRPEFLELAGVAEEFEVDRDHEPEPDDYGND